MHVYRVRYHILFYTKIFNLLYNVVIIIDVVYRCDPLSKHCGHML